MEKKKAVGPSNIPIHLLTSTLPAAGVLSQLAALASGVFALCQPRIYIASAPRYLNTVTVLDYSVVATPVLKASKVTWQQRT